MGVNSYKRGYIDAEWGNVDRRGSHTRINWCGRRYYPAPQALSAQEFAQVPEPRTWTHILTTRSGETVLAIPSTAAEKARYRTEVCAMILYVRESPDRYIEYPLSGGP